MDANTDAVEFCDCGDLGDLIKAYRLREQKHKTTEYIPESFIWHAFLALMDGLHFLATGSSYMSVDLNRGDIDAAKRAKPWTPIVHRDIKCDNVMLKSRSTPGSTKPLYVILTDFGMAEPEPVAAQPPVSTPSRLVGTKHGRHKIGPPTELG